MITSALPPVTEAQKQALRAAPRTPEAHRALMAQVPAMQAVQTGGNAPQTRLPMPLTVVAWNLERCLFPEDSAAHLAPHAPALILLSEVDHGMSRTAQRHTTEAMAIALNMHYAFGVEFFEMGLGGKTERAFCTDPDNTLGWHGNAILSAAPIARVTLCRLDDHGHWFGGDAADPGQPRLGGRMALIAQIDTEAGPICAVTTHLESNADADHRAVQFTRLMDAVDAFAPDLPVVIGGDLNTGNHLPPDFDWRRESLFGEAEARGYTWSATAEGVTTRPSLITPHPTRQMKLDWFATRGFDAQHKEVLSSVGVKGTALSDHDAVLARLARAP